MSLNSTVNFLNNLILSKIGASCCYIRQASNINVFFVQLCFKDVDHEDLSMFLGKLSVSFDVCLLCAFTEL